MVSYETVKYFNAEAYEFNRYREAVQKYQDAEWKVLLSLNIMNITQNMVFMLGLLVTCFIAAYQVTTGAITGGGFVTLIVFMGQLQSPLNFFGTFYRMIQSAMINSERMLELFKETATVVDKEDAAELPSCQGDLRFKDVHFSYDNQYPRQDPDIPGQIRDQGWRAWTAPFRRREAACCDCPYYSEKPQDHHARRSHCCT